MSSILVSPAERDAPILKLGRVSSLPERLGLDLLWWAQGSKWGIQRKAVADLRASVEDGRIGREVGQIRAAGVHAVVVVEGKATFTPDGTMLDAGFGRPWNKKAWWGVLLALQWEGLWVMNTATPTETAEFAKDFKVWSEKPNHGGWVGRAGPKGIWGTQPTQRDWGVHLLTSFAGIGPQVAGALFDARGRVPLQWTMEEDEMMKVEGLGKKRVGQLRKALADGQE